MTDAPFILAGLGNPGGKYDGSRHNIGFMAIDAVAAELGASADVQKWEAEWAKVSWNGAQVHLVKPMTYMNRSGRSVARFVDFFKLPLEHLVVVHDDLDMKVGRLKLVRGGGTGGHNGLRSLIAELGGADFYRLKIGIGRPGSSAVTAAIPVERFVLMPFADEDRPLIEARLTEVVCGLRTFFTQGPAHAMAYLNSFK